MTSVTSLKVIFSRYGIPVTFVSDNGPQFNSEEMRTFTKEYGFQHTTSSPYYPKSKGQAERTVKTVKHLLSNSPDRYLALLSYRARPLPFCGLSPAELSMGCKIRTDLPQPQQNLLPQWPYLDEYAEKHEKSKANQKRHYDKRHRVRPLLILSENQRVWVTTDERQVPGTVLQQTDDTPRSYCEH